MKGLRLIIPGKSTLVRRENNKISEEAARTAPYLKVICTCTHTQLEVIVEWRVNG